MGNNFRNKKAKRISFDKKYAIDILLGIKKATIRKTNKGLNPGGCCRFLCKGS